MLKFTAQCANIEKSTDTSIDKRLNNLVNKCHSTNIDKRHNNLVNKCHSTKQCVTKRLLGHKIITTHKTTSSIT